jgi:glycosyltransferase involved in cell wall biosynthesis
VRLLHLVGGSKFGGEAVIIQHLCAVAHSLGWEATVLATDPDAQRFYRQHAISVAAVDAIQRPINIFRDLLDLGKVYGYLRSARFDVVHTHTSKGGVIGRLAAKLAGVPLIVHTVHGFPFHEESSISEVTVYSMIERLAALCCHRVVTVSRYHRDWAIRLKIALPERIVSIQNGISVDHLATSQTREGARAEWNLAPGQVAILCTSRLAPQKGVEYLLRAVAHLKRKVSVPVTILLAGSGELAQSLTGLAHSLGVETNVRFLGFQRTIAGLLRASDIFALPSLWEGLSVSLLEAMAVGKPIVATSIGSNAEVLTESGAGLLVAPKDPTALACALATLINDPPLRTLLGQKAQETFRRQFTLSRMSRLYRDLYAELSLRNRTKDARVPIEVRIDTTDSQDEAAFAPVLRMATPSAEVRSGSTQLQGTEETTLDPAHNV